MAPPNAMWKAHRTTELENYLRLKAPLEGVVPFQGDRTQYSVSILIPKNYTGARNSNNYPLIKLSKIMNCMYVLNRMILPGISLCLCDLFRQMEAYGILHERTYSTSGIANCLHRRLELAWNVSRPPLRITPRLSPIVHLYNPKSEI